MADLCIPHFGTYRIPQKKCSLLTKQRNGEGEDEGEVVFFSAKRWDCRHRVDLIESATPCHDAQVVGLYRDSNPLRLTFLAAMSEDYTTAPQHLQWSDKISGLFEFLGKFVDFHLKCIYLAFYNRSRNTRYEFTSRNLGYT